jgi:hypothetical protein
VASQTLTGANASISVTYEGDLQNGVTEYAVKEAFRSGYSQLISTVQNDRNYYLNGLSGQIAQGLIDNVGAFSSSGGPYPGELTDSEIAAGITAAPPRELVRARFEAITGEGVSTAALTFTLGLANLPSPFFDTLVYGHDGRVPPSKLDAGTPRTLAVCDCPINAMPDIATVAEDSATGVTIEVLSNDVISPSAATAKELVSVSAPGPGQGTVVKIGDAVRFIPAKDFVGTAVFTYEVRDRTPGAFPDSAIGSVTVTVTPVNDAPTFVKGEDQNATDESGLVSVPAWATQIVAGPADEAVQSLAFLVTADNTALFSVQPQIDAAGKLTYTPALNANGVAEVSVRLKDSGGRENGGLDESLQTFSITITKERALHNLIMPLDSNGDGGITPIDALNVINYINSFHSGPVGESGSTPEYLDTNGDNYISPIDALEIINYINAFGSLQPPAVAPPVTDGEGESAAPDADGDEAALISLLASDIAEHGRRRRS